VAAGKLAFPLEENMKKSIQILLTAALVCVGGAASPAFAKGPKQQEGRPATESAPTDAPADGGSVQVKTPVAFALSAPLRELPPAPGGTAAQFEAEDEFPHLLPKRLNGTPGPDLAAQTVSAPDTMPGATVFAGQQNPAACGGCLPPDTNGDIGPNHYVQVVNTQIAVYDRSGALQPGFPKNINTLWSGLGGNCAATNDGDPIALYDHLADRWFVSQFSLPNYPNGPFYQCLAVSQSPDPTGSYYEYDFQWSSSDMNDYPHFGVWPDGYYMTVHNFTNGASWHGQGVAVFERDAMLAGNPAARMVQFETLYNVNPPCSNNYGGMLPSHLEGPAPAAGTPNYFMEADAQNEICSGDPSSVKIWQFHIDWTTPGNSTFGNASAGNAGPPNSVVNVTNFTRLCPTTSSCVPQGGTTRRLDGLGDRLMYRVAYRNFGAYDAVVLNHSASVSGIAGIRWYEIHDLSSPTLIQQSTYNPDSTYRWMGSVNLDASNDIAVGFSASDSTINPQIRYAGRLVGDPINTLGQGEATMLAGGGHQTSTSNRWGDYSSLSVDPTDQCTFWFTTEYYSATSTSNWNTEVGNFKFPSCNSCTPPASPNAGSNSPICAGQTLQLTASTVTGATYSWTGPNGFSSNLQNPTIPNATTADAGAYSVTATVSNCASLPATTSVTVNPTPDATITAASTVCAGSTGDTASVPGAGAGATYAWTITNGSITGGNGTNSITYTAGTAGSLSLDITVTTAAGCSSPGSKSVTVNAIPSAPTAGNNGPVCAGQTLNLTASTVAGATYSWTGPNGFTSSQQNPSIPNAQPAATGTYSVTAMVGGCTSVPGTTTATVNALPSAPTAGNNGPICEGQTLNLTASSVAGATYSWTGPNGFTSTQQNPSIPSATAAASGSYSVTATVNGCTSAAGTTAASVQPVPAPAITATLCLTPNTSGLTASVPANAGDTYNWTITGGTIDSGQGTAAISFTSGPAATSMTLNVVETTTAGCTGSAGETMQVNFIDVPASNPFYTFICTITRNGITAGCGSGNYCPNSDVLRSQMAVFILRGEHGSVYTPPPATGIFGDVPVSNPFAPWIEQAYSEGITGGCSSNPLLYCPGNAVTRASMAVFLLTGEHGAGYVPPPATGIFADVPASNPFAPWIEQLYTEGITAGCGTNPLIYCPGNAVVRSQMAVFLTVTFSLP
jgi:hypothetical protein